MKFLIAQLISTFLVLGTSVAAFASEVVLPTAKSDADLVLSTSEASDSLDVVPTVSSQQLVTPKADLSVEESASQLKAPETMSFSATQGAISISPPSVSLDFEVQDTDKTGNSEHQVRPYSLSPTPSQPQYQPAAPDIGGTTGETETTEEVPLTMPDFSLPTPAPVPTPTPTSENSKPVESVTKAIASSLFATKKSPGSIAVGAAEGNLTVTGNATSLYSGHTDPGNHVINRGFCSWNRSKNLTVAQADSRCLTSLQRKSAATEQKLTSLELDAGDHTEALVNGSDLWNQSNSAGPKFAIKYKQALDKGLKGDDAYIWARVEAFRNKSGVLDASGLFGICAREPYYQRQLKGIKPYSETWRWQCIALDQKRRVGMVGKVLKRNIGETQGQVESTRVEEPENSLTNLGTHQQHDRSVTSDVLSFDPMGVQTSITPAPTVNLTSAPTQKIASSENQLDFSISFDNEAIANEGQYNSNQKQGNADKNSTDVDSPPHPLTPEVLNFAPVWENTDTVEQTSNTQASALPLDTGLDTGKATPSNIDEWEPNLEKIPNKGDKIAGYRVTSPYGKRIHPVTKRAHFHTGVDVATPTKTNLYAIGKPGTQTTLICWFDTKGGGLVATMKAESLPNLRFDALHLSWCKAKTNSSPIKVDAGEIIGKTGNTGRSTGPHLHFQMRNEKTGKRISPTKKYIWWVLTGNKA